jgi:hypothetical protein
VLVKSPTGVCYQKISSLCDLEQLIVDFCVWLSTMGEALTKKEVKTLADDILVDSIFVNWLLQFCKKRNILKEVI